MTAAGNKQQATSYKGGRESHSLTIRPASVADAATVALLFSEFNAILGADGLPDDEAFLAENVIVSAAQMTRRLSDIVGLETVLLAFDNSLSLGYPSPPAERGRRSRGRGFVEPAGLAALRLVPYIGQDAPYAELTQLFVRERFQRRGVGAALIDAAEHLALEGGATCVHIITGADNVGAQAFYSTRGYAMNAVELEKHFGEGAHA